MMESSNQQEETQVQPVYFPEVHPWLEIRMLLWKRWPAVCFIMIVKRLVKNVLNIVVPGTENENTC